MTIGAVWIEHSALVDALDHIDGVFMRLNLVLLLFCAFLPFPTRMMSEWAGNMPAERVAVVFYGIVLLVMTLMLMVLGRHAEREGLFGDDVVDERKEEARVKYQLTPEPHRLRRGGDPRLPVAAPRHQPLPAHRHLAGDPAPRRPQAVPQGSLSLAGGALRRPDLWTTLTALATVS